MREFTAALALPTLTGADGTVHTATRQPRLRDGIGFVRALEEQAGVSVQLDGARAILLGMGFPEAVVDDLDLRAAVEAASGFFSAALTRDGDDR